MRQFIVRSVARTEHVGFRRSSVNPIFLPYENAELGIHITEKTPYLLFNGDVLSQYLNYDPVRLLLNEHSTAFLLFHNSTLTSFALNQQGVFEKLDQQRFEGYIYGTYQHLFICVPSRVETPKRYIVETKEDEAYLPASYNASARDFEHFEQLYGRRDTYYLPARTREMRGVWLLEAEHLRDPFDCILLPREITTVESVFSCYNDIFVVSMAVTYRFTRQSGIWSLAAEFAFHTAVSNGALHAFSFLISFDEFYDPLRLQDRKIVSGSAYPFYDSSEVCGAASAVARIDGLIYCFYDRTCTIYKEIKAPEHDRKAPEIAGCTADVEQLLIDRQNAMHPAPLVDLENLQEGYDINNDVDLFRNDFKQQFEPLYTYQQIDKKLLPGMFLGLLWGRYVLLATNDNECLSVYDVVAPALYTVPDGAFAGWQISSGALHIFTKNAIISPFAPLDFSVKHFFHGIRTASVDLQCRVRGKPLMYYKDADYEVLSALSRIDDAIEAGNLIIIISGNILVVYDSGEPIFTQLIEPHMKLVAFDGLYSLTMFSTVNHFLEIRCVSVLLRRHLEELLRKGANDEFLDLLPSSRYSLTSFFPQFPGLLEYALTLSADALKVVLELATLPPPEDYDYSDSHIDLQFYQAFLEARYGIVLSDLQRTCAAIDCSKQEEQIAVQFLSLAAINFAFIQFGYNDYARYVVLQNSIFALRNLKEFYAAMLKFMDITEYDAFVQQTQQGQSKARLASEGVVFEPFRLLKGEFQDSLCEYSLGLVDGEILNDDIEVLSFYAGKRGQAEALFRVFAAKKNDPQAIEKLSVRFSDFCIAQHLGGKQYSLNSYEPCFYAKDYASDLYKYITNKTAKAGKDFVAEEDYYVQRYRKLIKEQKIQQAKYQYDLQQWREDNKEALMVYQFLAL